MNHTKLETRKKEKAKETQIITYNSCLCWWLHLDMGIAIYKWGCFKLLEQINKKERVKLKLYCDCI